MKNRRSLLIVLGATALAPRAVFAQAKQVAPAAGGAQTTGILRRVGILNTGSPGNTLIEEFRKGLQELGHREGKNLKLEYRWAEGRPERLQGLADELVRINVESIFTSTTPGALAAKSATATIPIVFVGVGDPVGAGVVSSLARPGGNVTGLTHFSVDLIGKTLELLKEVVPGLREVAVIAPSSNPTTALKLARIQSAAPGLGVKVQVLEVRRPGDFELAFESIRRQKPTALMALLDTLTNTRKKEITDFARTYRLPSIFEQREYVEAGGLVSYGTNFPAMYRHAATYVDKILKGAKPSDLPVEQPTKFELVVNMTTARAVGIKIPQSVLVRADKVIE